MRPPLQEHFQFRSLYQEFWIIASSLIEPPHLTSPVHFKMKLPPAILTLAFPTLLLAHGNHDAVASLESRNALSSCLSGLTSRSHVEAHSAKTNAFVNAYLSKRGLPSNYEARDDPPSTAACILAPE